MVLILYYKQTALINKAIRMGLNFDTDREILVFKPKGTIGKEHIKDFYKHLAVENNYPRKLRTLIDAWECQFNFEIKDLSELFNELEIAIKNYTSIREAIVVGKPYETAIATLFSGGYKNPNYKFKVFSTRSAAEKWLLHG